MNWNLWIPVLVACVLLLRLARCRHHETILRVDGNERWYECVDCLHTTRRWRDE